MRKGRSVSKRKADAVEAAAAAEGEHAGLGRGLGGERSDISEPGSVRTTPVSGLAQGGTGRPGKVDGDGVVVGQDAAVRLEELAALVVPVGSL